MKASVLPLLLVFGLGGVDSFAPNTNPRRQIIKVSSSMVCLTLSRHLSKVNLTSIFSCQKHMHNAAKAETAASTYSFFQTTSNYSEHPWR